MQPEEALNTILDLAKSVDHEILHYSDAVGRVLLEEVSSKISLPPYNNSAMDGFAFSYEDFKLRRQLNIIGTIKAGDITTDLFLKEGECVRIMTGAALPQNADTVVEFENTRVVNNVLEIEGTIQKGKNVRIKGEDISKGEPLKELTFQLLTPARISRLVSTGNFMLKVNRKARVAIISTGNELKYPCENIDDNTIIESNGEYIKGVLMNMGAEAIYKGICTDDFDSIKSFLEASENCDAIITIGGISKGDYDIIKIYGETLGISWLFNKVEQKPGKPFSFGIYKNKPLFAFPGNPLSSAFCLFYYFLPALRKMMGLKDPYSKSIKGYLGKSYFKKNNRNLFINVKINFDNGNVIIMPYEKQNSNMINALISTNGYAKIPASMSGEIEKGTLLDVYSTGFECL